MCDFRNHFHLVISHWSIHTMEKQLYFGKKEIKMRALLGLWTMYELCYMVTYSQEVLEKQRRCGLKREARE